MSSSVDAGGSRVGKDFWGVSWFVVCAFECVREHEVDESYSGLPRGNQLRRSGARIKRQGCLRIREVPEAGCKQGQRNC